MAGLFEGTINLLDRSLDLRSLRQKLISSNIANQETPGYKAVDIDFKAALNKAEGETLPLIKGDERHLEGVSGGGSGEVSLQKTGIDEGYDKNSVNIEMEMAKMAENTLMYNAAAEILARKFKGLEYAVREGR
jgi:flagellar basal-body rod protein FlgB